MANPHTSDKNIVLERIHAAIAAANGHRTIVCDREESPQTLFHDDDGGNEDDYDDDDDDSGGNNFR